MGHKNAAGRTPPADRATCPGRRVVLYIEDALSNLELIERLLASRPDAKLIPAMQGRLGLELARQHRPDLILLDPHLPDLPGEEVLRRLQEAPETRGIPVVTISADALPAGQAGRLVRARTHLATPLDVRKFLALLDDLLGEPEAHRGGAQV